MFFQLNEDLEKKGRAYRGLMYKKAVENLPVFVENNASKFVFIGLNALSNAERKIIFELEKTANVKLYWDSDKDCIDSIDHAECYDILTVNYSNP